MKIPRFIRHSWSYNGMKTTNLGKKYLIHSGKVIPNKEVDSHLAAAPVLKMKEYANKPLVGIVKDGVHFDGYVSVIASWFYYERFLKVNDIPYRFYDIYAHDWLEQAKQFDIIIWRTESTPEEMYIAESKIYILENVLHKECFPSFHEVWQYEDKNRATFLYTVYSDNYFQFKRRCFEYITETGLSFYFKGAYWVGIFRSKENSFKTTGCSSFESGFLAQRG